MHYSCLLRCTVFRVDIPSSDKGDNRSHPGSTAKVFQRSMGQQLYSSLHSILMHDHSCTFSVSKSYSALCFAWSVLSCLLRCTVFRVDIPSTDQGDNRRHPGSTAKVFQRSMGEQPYSNLHRIPHAWPQLYFFCLEVLQCVVLRSLTGKCNACSICCILVSHFCCSWKLSGCFCCRSACTLFRNCCGSWPRKQSRQRPLLQ